MKKKYIVCYRSAREPDEFMESNGSLPVWRSGIKLDLHRITLWNVDGRRTV